MIQLFTIFNNYMLAYFNLKVSEMKCFTFLIVEYSLKCTKYGFAA